MILQVGKPNSLTKKDLLEWLDRYDDQDEIYLGTENNGSMARLSSDLMGWLDPKSRAKGLIIYRRGDYKRAKNILCTPCQTEKSLRSEIKTEMLYKIRGLLSKDIWKATEEFEKDSE